MHAMRAETTEALVVCSEHVGSAPEQANAVLPVRLPLFGLVTRGVAEKEYVYRASSAVGGELCPSKRSLLCLVLVLHSDLKTAIFFVIFADRACVCARA